MKPPYTIDPEYKQPTLLSLAGDLLLAVVGVVLIIGVAGYFMRGW